MSYNGTSHITKYQASGDYYIQVRADHECQREPEPIPEKTVVCPRGLCGKKMKQSKLQEHIKKEHIDFQGEW